MKRIAVVLGILAMGVAGCGGSNNSTGPSNAPTVFTVALNPANEVPPVTGDEASARGTAIITVNTTRDSAGTVTGGTINFNVSLNSFPGSTSSLRAAHIHNAGAGVNAGVFVDTGMAQGSVPVSNGSATFNLTANPTADQINQILANPQNFYFNVHTPTNAGGVMRGQLR